jgi:hypothetical protein
MIREAGCQQESTPASADALRAELEGRGVDVKDGQWGYRLMVIADPDGNELYFPYPTSLATSPVITSNAGAAR